MSHYFNETDLEELHYCSAYADYIMEHAKGDRIICNGDTLTVAMEDGYLFDEFVKHVEDTMECGEALKLLEN